MKYTELFRVIDDISEEYIQKWIDVANIESPTNSKEGNDIAYHQYKEIFTQYNASVKNLIALIKKNNLHLSFPFLIEK